jgi:membrane peptidoglycan carboxypeptidase
MTNQMAIRAGVRQFENRFKPYLKTGKYNLYYAALVVDVGSGKIVGHYGGKGNSDLTTFGKGQPMASLIKPFVLHEYYLEQGGEVWLYDGPIANKRTPKNFDHPWTYRFVGVTDIIKYSKNAPVVNIREKTDAVELYRKVEDRFAQMGIMPDADLNFSDTKWCEINYPLGSRKMRLLDIAQSYQALVNNGKAMGISALQSDFNPKTQETGEPFPKIERQVFDSEASSVMLEAMQETIFGGTASSIRDLLPPGNVYYVKTGTSEHATKCFCSLSDGNLLILSYVNYGTIVNNRLELNEVPPVPLHNNSTATTLAAMLYKEMISKNY